MKSTKYSFSDRDKKLVILFLAAVILICVYRFVYYPNLRIEKKLQKEVSRLKMIEYDLQQKNSKADEVVSENKKKAKEINDIIDRYGSGTSNQKVLIFLENLEYVSGMEISSIEFLQTENISSIAPAQNDTVDTDASKSAATAGNAVSANEESAVEITGYDSIVAIEFKVDSEGLKKSIDYINNYSERMNIKELNITYDMTTGNLNGSMQINMYQLANTGRKYEDPAIAGVNIGTQNLFGTIDIKQNKKHNKMQKKNTKKH